MPELETEPPSEEADPADLPEERGGMPLLEALGGKLGIAEATVPFIAFTVAWTASGRDIVFGGIVAVAITAVLAFMRLRKRQSVQYALSGLIGVAVGAFVAARTGEASNFFLPGLITNAAWLLAYLISIVVRRPLLGLLVSQFTDEGKDWYQDPTRLRAYTLASWIWVGVFSVRLAIQVPLFISDAVAPLAVARVVTGAPLLALGLWLSYLVLKPTLDAVGGLRMPSAFER